MMKKILVLALILVLAGCASIPHVQDGLKSVLAPYLQQWGQYDGYELVSHPIKGDVCGFFWVDTNTGLVMHYVIFIYVFDGWRVYEASGELMQIPPAVYR